MNIVAESYLQNFLLIDGYYLSFISILNSCCHLYNSIDLCGGARGLMVIIAGNEHGDTSSNPGRD